MEEVRKTMEQVRDWCMNNRYAINSRGYDRDLCGMCCIASARLFESLQSLGYSPVLAISEGKYGSAHCFIVLDDLVLDITATQFNAEAISIVHEKLAEQHWWWIATKLFYSVDALVKYQRRVGFPKHQLATHDAIRYNVNTFN